MTSNNQIFKTTQYLSLNKLSMPLKKTNPQIIKDLNKDPYPILEHLTVKEIVAIIKDANKAYHNNSQPIFTDDTYDIIKEYLAKLVPNHPILTEVGSIPKKAKVQLPYYLGSLDKIKDDAQTQLANFTKTFNTPHEYIITDKLDGITALYLPQQQKLYTRGDGHTGQDISHLLKFLKLPAINTKNTQSIAIRGELIISRKNWQTILKSTNPPSNPRNTVAGLANAKRPDPIIIKFLEFIPYEIINSTNTPLEDLVTLQAQIHYQILPKNQLNPTILSDILITRRKSSPYDIDGIVIRHNAKHPYPTSNNPTYAFAFKSLITQEKAEVIVKSIQWNVSKNGLLKPVVHFDTVKISNVHISRATGHNAAFIEKNKLGPGARIIIIRSGDVIPYIYEVLSPATSNEPSFPSQIEYPWKWSLTKTDIQLENPETEKEYHLSKLLNYSAALNIKGLGARMINKLYNHGITSIKHLINITKLDLYKATLSSKLTLKIYSQMQAIYNTGTCVEFMTASNIFGAGLGKRKFQYLIELFPQILDNNPPTFEELIESPGIGERVARQFLDHLPQFFEFLQEVGIPCRSSIIDAEPTPDGFMSVSGKIIVFTGFRSKKLEELIIRRGGKVATSVSSNTSILVAKIPNDTNIKLETARELNIPIFDFKVFCDEIGFDPTTSNTNTNANANVQLKELDDIRQQLYDQLDKEALDELKENEDDDDSSDDEPSHLKTSSLPKKAECIRHMMNWSNMKRTHIFGKSTFDVQSVRQDLPIASPKLNSLIENIKKLDENDHKKHKTTFKHMIFSDVIKRGYGAKIIASALDTHGFIHAYDKDFNIQLQPNSFAVLASTQIYTKPITTHFKKHLLDVFNKRPDNIHGENIRIIVLDSGYREGIDLFDVKYVHLFEPFLTIADEKQAIGRALRYCGQKGLHYNNGWTVQVFKYEHSLSPKLQEKYNNAKTSYDMILKETPIDPTWQQLTIEIEEIAKKAAIDAAYTYNIHYAHSKTQPNSTISPSSPYNWIPITNENLCTIKANKPQKLLEYSPTQLFIRHYFQPQTPIKGMLLWHSVGSGKTCSAIAAASTHWEAEGYTILWVTRVTLRTDVYKNIFDTQQSCLERIRNLVEADIDIPNDPVKKKKLLSRLWLPPISFKQFTNLLNKQNRLYDYLLKLNGFNDPFKRTLIIIDEAHLMQSPTLKDKERPDIDLLKKWLRYSYKTSGQDSARLLLMTATPITDNPYNFIKLMNLTSETDIPEDPQAFQETYLQIPPIKFTKQGQALFSKQISNRISYLDRTRDYRQFAQPTITTITTPISEPYDITPLQNTISNLENDITELKKLKLGDTKKRFLEELDKQTQQKLNDCESKPTPKAKKECITETKKSAREEKQLIDDKARVLVADAKEQIQQSKEKQKAIKAEIKEKRKNDNSIASQIARRCFGETTSRRRKKKSNTSSPHSPIKTPKSQSTPPSTTN